MALENAIEKGEPLHIGIVLGQTIAKLKELENQPSALEVLDEVYVVGDPEQTYYKLAHQIQKLT